MTAEEWFAKAVVRMIISDKILHRMEWKSLKLSIRKLGLKMDMEEIFALLQDNINTNPEEFQLESMTSISIDKRVKMALELAKIAAIDKKVIGEEVRFLKKATLLLGLNRVFFDKLLDWLKTLVKLNKDEKALYKLANK